MGFAFAADAAMAPAAALNTAQGQAAKVQSKQSSALSQAISQLKAQELAKVIQEAASALQETQQALLLLQKGKVQEALQLLQKVQVTLEQLIQKYGMVKLPVDVQFIEFNGVEDLELAMKYNKQVKKLVAENDFVDARILLALLRDEIDIVTTYLPLGLYKQAIDLAVKLLQAGQVQAAILAIQSALGTLEVETVIVPKPILEAQYLIAQAEKIYKVNPDLAMKLISRAEYDLRLSVALGYIRSLEDVKPLLEKLEELKKAIEAHAATVEEKFQEATKGMQKVRQEATTTTH